MSPPNAEDMGSLGVTGSDPEPLLALASSICIRVARLVNSRSSVFFSTVNQVSEKYYSPDGELVYDTNPQVEDAFQVAVDAHDAGISAGIAAWSSGWAPGRANGAFAVTVAPSWILQGIKTDAPDTAGDWRVARPV